MKWRDSRALLVSAFQEGKFRVGDALPGIRQLARLGYGTFDSVRRALHELRREGIIAFDDRRQAVLQQNMRQSHAVFETYEAAVQDFLKRVKRFPEKLHVSVCENWLPCSFEGDKCSPRFIKWIYRALSEREKKFKAGSTRARFLITWPGDTGSLLRRLWTRRETWGADHKDLFQRFEHRSERMCQEICVSNRALVELAQERADVVELRYMMGWASCPFVFADSPYNLVAVGRYHASRSSFDAPGEVRMLSEPLGAIHREEFLSLWELSVPHASIRNEFVMAEIHEEILWKFHHQHKSYFDYFERMDAAEGED